MEELQTSRLALNSEYLKQIQNPVKQFNIKIHIEQDTVVTGQPLQNTDRYTSDHRPSFYKVFLKYSKEMIKTYIYTLKR